MKIWVDADACPKPIKDILFRAAQRREVEVTLVANHALPTPKTPHVTALQVPKGFDEADNEIVKRLESGDLVVTADIPLAAEVIEHGGVALNPRGELYTTENIRERLAMRDMMEELRSSGEIGGGPATLNNQDRQAFANQLDRLLTRALGAGK